MGGPEAGLIRASKPFHEIRESPSHTSSSLLLYSLLIKLELSVLMGTGRFNPWHSPQPPRLTYSRTLTVLRLKLNTLNRHKMSETTKSLLVPVIVTLSGI
jgi:hypothetical protein